MIKFNLSSKLYFAIKIFVLFTFVCIKSYADNSKPNKNLISFGENDAVIKIKVFSSLTCPHCANFHKKVIPELKKEYVESGKAQLIFIDFPLDQAAFNASKLLHCVDRSMQMKLLDTIYEKQNEWTNGSNINDINNNLKKIAKNLGISSNKFNGCLVDQSISDRILDGRINANKKYSIESTPTIVINEKKLEGSVSFNNIKKNIEKII